MLNVFGPLTVHVYDRHPGLGKRSRYGCVPQILSDVNWNTQAVTLICIIFGADGDSSV